MIDKNLWSVHNMLWVQLGPYLLEKKNSGIRFYCDAHNTNPVMVVFQKYETYKHDEWDHESSKTDEKRKGIVDKDHAWYNADSLLVVCIVEVKTCTLLEHASRHGKSYLRYEVDEHLHDPEGIRYCKDPHQALCEAYGAFASGPLIHYNDDGTLKIKKVFKERKLVKEEVPGRVTRYTYDEFGNVKRHTTTDEGTEEVQKIVHQSSSW